MQALLKVQIPTGIHRTTVTAGRKLTIWTITKAAGTIFSFLEYSRDLAGTW